MNRVLVLGRTDPGGKNDPVELTSYLNRESDVAVFADYKELTFIIEDQVSILLSEEDISKYDLVVLLGWYKNHNKIYYKDLAFSIALHLKSKGVEFWNSEAGRQRSTTKLSAMIALSLGGVRVPRTVFSLNKDYIKRYMIRNDEMRIYKALAASRGDHNYLIENPDDIDSFANDVPCMLLQEYIPNVSDLRVICVDGEPAYAVERKSNGSSHLNNTSKGGIATRIKIQSLDKRAVDIARKSAKILDRELGGVDLIYSEANDAYCCLEVNPLPQLTTGSNVDEKLKVISNKINSKFLQENEV